MLEEWKDIRGYEGLYQVSSLGRVRSLERKVLGRDGVVYTHHGTMMKLAFTGCGYPICYLSKMNKSKSYLVHRLVAQAFVRNPNPVKYTMINHKDENKKNARKENLEWCDRSYNMQYGSLRTKRSKLINIYKADNQEYIGSSYNSEIKRALCCNRSMVNMCARGVRKSVKGFTLRHADRDTLISSEIKVINAETLKEINALMTE